MAWERKKDEEHKLEAEQELKLIEEGVIKQNEPVLVQPIFSSDERESATPMPMSV